MSSPIIGFVADVGSFEKKYEYGDGKKNGVQQHPSCFSLQQSGKKENAESESQKKKVIGEVSHLSVSRGLLLWDFLFRKPEWRRMYW